MRKGRRKIFAATFKSISAVMLVVIFTATLFTLTACDKSIFSNINNDGSLTPKAELKKYTGSFFGAFDTKTDLVAYAASEEDFQRDMEILREKFVYYNNLYDIYNSYEGINNIKTINDNAGKAPVVVDREIINLLKYAIELYSTTNGQTNIAMGSVLTIWHDYRTDGIDTPEKAMLPSEQILRAAAEYISIEDIIIDEEASTVFLKDSRMSIDVGSIGKGYAVQRVAEFAKSIGYTNMLISAGGNVSAIGMKTDGSQWKVGVQNPDLNSSEPYSEKIYLAPDECIVTSGDYQRYYYVGDTKYCHIIDPDTLYPASYFASVSIVTTDSGKADALSTAVFCMPVEEGVAFINSLDNVEAMWILHDGSKVYSTGFKEKIAK